MWVLKKINQEQELASGKFSSQSKLAEFMGIHPRTLNKALKEGRNSFQFRGETVSVHQLPEFSAHDSSGNQKFFEKEAQIVEFFGVSRQTVYLAFKLNQSEKKFKKDGKVWIVKRNFSPEDEVPICKDQKSQSLKNPTSTSTKKKSVPDQRSHTMKASYTNQKRLPQKPPPPPAEDLRKNGKNIWMKSIEKRKGGRKFAMKTSETFCGVSSHGLFYHRLFPWVRIHELRCFIPTQTLPKSCQVTLTLGIISRMKI